LRVEEREMDTRAGVHGPQRPGLLGGARVPHPRGSLAGGAVLLSGGPEGRARAVGDRFRATSTSRLASSGDRPRTPSSVRTWLSCAYTRGMRPAEVASADPRSRRSRQRYDARHRTQMLLLVAVVGALGTTLANKPSMDHSRV